MASSVIDLVSSDEDEVPHGQERGANAPDVINLDSPCLSQVQSDSPHAFPYSRPLARRGFALAQTLYTSRVSSGRLRPYGAVASKCSHGMPTQESASAAGAYQACYRLASTASQRRPRPWLLLRTQLRSHARHNAPRSRLSPPHTQYHPAAETSHRWRG